MTLHNSTGPLTAPLIKEEGVGARRQGGGDHPRPHPFVIHPRGREILYGVRGRCVVMTTIGPMRSGKSWIQNYTMGKEGMLVASNKGRETQGVDLALPRLTVSQLATYWGLERGDFDGKDDRQMICLDVEGQMDRDEKYDYTITAPAALVSDIIIMNVSHYPGMNDTLNKLALLYQLTRRLHGDDGNFKLGHVIVVIRNFTNQQTAEQIREEIIGQEPERRGGEEARKRNEIRRYLNEWFQSVTVYALPTPADDQVIARSTTLSFQQVSARFKESVRGLIKVMVGQVQDGKYRAQGLLGTRMDRTGPVICEAMEGVLDHLDEDGIQVPNLVEATYEGITKRQKELVEAELQEKWPGWERELNTCKDEQALVDFIRPLCLRVLEAAQSTFRSKVKGVPETIIIKHWNEVVMRVHERFELVEKAAIARMREASSEGRRVEAQAKADNLQKSADGLKQQLIDGQDKMATMQKFYADQMESMKDGWKKEREGMNEQLRQMTAQLDRMNRDRSDPVADIFGKVVDGTVKIITTSIANK